MGDEPMWNEEKLTRTAVCIAIHSFLANSTANYTAIAIVINIHQLTTCILYSVNNIKISLTAILVTTGTTTS